MSDPVILESIPHRPPFLFVDRVLEHEDNRLVAEWTLSPDLDFFRGHYPGQPIVPGVLLNEAIFQATAVMLVFRARARGEDPAGKTPVLSRITDARFREMVLPGDTVRLEVRWKESMSHFHFCEGIVWKGEKKAATLSYALALVGNGGG